MTLRSRISLIALAATALVCSPAMAAAAPVDTENIAPAAAAETVIAPDTANAFADHSTVAPLGVGADPAGIAAGNDSLSVESVTDNGAMAGALDS